ncbi:MAG: transglutaminase family protein [Gaiellaceae bacterium]
MSRRSVLAALAPALVIAAMWVRLEQAREQPLRLAALVALALAAAFVRPRVATVAFALVAGARLAFGFWWHPLRIASRFGAGFLDFYDVKLPFDPRVQPEMRSVILVAVLAFALAVALAIASGRIVTAVLVILLGAGWPATLAGNTSALAKGAAIAAAILTVLALRTSRRLPRAALPVACALVLAGVAASSSSAVAKGELVRWQGWNFSTAPQKPVSVSYVWDAQYGGLRFPRLRTTVLKIKAPATSLYWRAALLDDFVADRWIRGAPRGGDSLEPAASRDRKRWIRADVTVEALSDTRLVGGSTPVAFTAGAAPLRRPEPGEALLPSGLTRGFQYTAYSYAPQPKSRALARSEPEYPRPLRSLLEVSPGVTMPAFGVANRTRRTNALLDAHPQLERYVPLARAAQQVAGSARTPYGAVAALESWFRTSGGFTYSAHPYVSTGSPLVGFVVQARAGYCQYFAGAMALMLRYLGVPARVAVGFSSGTYDAKKGEWTVTDHDAHAWVEAWFRGYGWLPFDPTPPAGRPEQGELSAAYAAAAGAGPTALGRGGANGQGPPPSAAHRHGESGSGTSGTSAPARAAAAAGRHGSLLVLLAVLAGAILAAIAGTKLTLRRSRYLARDPRRIAAACRRELADFLLDQRIDAARSATLHELGALVRGELAVDPDRFVAAATAARFGPPAGAPVAARVARRELRALVRRIRARLTARERACGLLSLRSLGFAP